MKYKVGDKITVKSYMLKMDMPKIQTVKRIVGDYYYSNYGLMLLTHDIKGLAK